jgi:hypothetical protein
LFLKKTSSALLDISADEEIDQFRAEAIPPVDELTGRHQSLRRQDTVVSLLEIDIMAAPRGLPE